MRQHMTRSWTLRAGLALCLPMAAAATTDITLKRLDESALEVSYALPVGCERAQFERQDPASRDFRQRWEPLDACGASDGVSLAAVRPSCLHRRFRVPTTTARAAAFPPAFPMHGATYVHTGDYALGGTCGESRYFFEAAQIGVAGGFVKGRASPALSSDGQVSALLLDASALVQHHPMPAYLAPNLPDSEAKLIMQRAIATAQALERALPDARFKPVILAATQVQLGGERNVGGDAHDVMRLTLFDWPASPDRSSEQLLTRLVSHEISHRFQLRDITARYKDARLIHEGGGEFLRWLVSLEQGWITPDEAAAELEGALLRCMSKSEGRSWAALSLQERNALRRPYDCGLALYTTALAEHPGQGDAFARINAFYRELAAGRPPELASALACGEAKPCEPRELRALLEGPEPMSQAWQRWLSRLPWVRPHPSSPAQQADSILQWLVLMMKEDCQGAVSLTPEATRITLDGMAQCATLREDLPVTTIDGRPLAEPGLPGRIAARCHEDGSILLGSEAGRSVQLRCIGTDILTQPSYRVDMQALYAALRGKPLPRARPERPEAP
ncbi:hypothetical protein ACS5PK_18990 [Roseateles sp. DB2]|uniref:hypothetical protein n=1 Tax=Roseateles sp. DB2 TaxID=3453717 RepID=UPI003EEB9DF2